MYENYRNLRETNEKWNLTLLSQKFLLNCRWWKKRTPEILVIDQFEKSLTIAHSKICQYKAEFLVWRKLTTILNFPQKEIQLFCYLVATSGWTYLSLNYALFDEKILYPMLIKHCLTKKYFISCQGTGVFKYIVLILI